LRPNLPTTKPFQAEALKTQTAELEHFSTLTFSPYAKVDAIDAILTQQLPATINAGAAVGAIADTLNNQINELLKQGLQLTN
jgi:multiple sugar transport system substrate-binding protein